MTLKYETFHQKPKEWIEWKADIFLSFWNTNLKYMFMDTIFHSVHTVYNKVTTQKTLKHWSCAGAETLSPGPHWRGRKLEENP